jgi:methyl-accepting chemotaxis protein
MIRRTNYFIKKGFQLNFAIKFALLILLEAGLIAGLFMQVSGNTITTGYSDSILTIERTPNFFMMPLLFIMLITAIGIGIAAMIIFILLSHRIAGPLYRFEKDLGDIGYGDLTKRISLRKSDQLTDIKEALNSVVATFDERMGKVKSILLELKALTDNTGSDNTAKIQSAVKRLREEVDRFRVTSDPKE